jgi:peptidoglycan L-alanyl-D-glutamate endopeptidase CwlK
MTFRFSKRSRQRLDGVHPDLVRVMELAISRSPVDFTVLEGLRTKERQRQLVDSGASKTMNSRHLTGHAVDVAPMSGGSVSWDWPLYHKLAPVIKEAAEELDVDIEWGGDWTSFKDGPHWQLSWNSYGKQDMAPRARLVRADGASAVPAPEPVPSIWSTIINAILSLFVKGQK